MTDQGQMSGGRLILGRYLHREPKILSDSVLSATDTGGLQWRESAGGEPWRGLSARRG